MRLASCEEVVFVGERSCVLLVCITQILSRGFLCGKSCVDDIMEILLCEGGDVEQWLEPRNISLLTLKKDKILIGPNNV